MEALAQWGTINSIIQLVEFTGKFLPTGVELYRSTDGALAENVSFPRANESLLEARHLDLPRQFSMLKIMNAVPPLQKSALETKRLHQETQGLEIFRELWRLRSGKSMLMKYIYKDGPYLSARFARLETVPLVTASFYTWKGGTDPPKTQEGLFRSLLYEIIDEMPALQQSYSKKRRRGGKKETQSRTRPFMDPAKVTTFVVAMLEQITIPLKWALLDECLDKLEEDLEDNLGVLNLAALYSHVTIHLSDHRLLILEDAFDEYPNLELYRFTSSDIEAQVNDRLLDNAILRGTGGWRPIERQASMDEMIHKASGLFIQVKVVVQSLLGYLHNFDRFSHLIRKPEHLLAEIGDLDDHILAKALRNYHLQAIPLSSECGMARGSPLAIQPLFADESVNATTQDSIPGQRSRKPCYKS